MSVRVQREIKTSVRVFNKVKIETQRRRKRKKGLRMEEVVGGTSERGKKR